MYLESTTFQVKKWPYCTRCAFITINSYCLVTCALFSHYSQGESTHSTQDLSLICVQSQLNICMKLWLSTTRILGKAGFPIAGMCRWHIHTTPCWHSTLGVHRLWFCSLSCPSPCAVYIDIQLNTLIFLPSLYFFYLSETTWGQGKEGEQHKECYTTLGCLQGPKGSRHGSRAAIHDL